MGGIYEGIEDRGTSIRIRMSLSGIKFYESIKKKTSPKNLKKAYQLRCAVYSAFENDKFNYYDFFPEGPNGAKFADLKGDRLTVKARLKIYISDCKKNESLSPETIIQYERSIKAHLDPNFGDKRLSELRKKHFITWCDKTGYVQSTIDNHLIPLAQVFDKAFNLEQITSNVLAGWRPTAPRKTNKKTDDKIDPFDYSEIELILTNTKEEQDYNSYLFHISTGLRISELLGLQWPSVDLNKRRVLVEHTHFDNKLYNLVKTDAAYRFVDLNDAAFTAISAQKKHTFLNNQYVFNNPRTGKPWSSSTRYNKVFKNVLKRAGIRYRPAKQFRHSWITLAFEAGEFPQWIAKQVGHTDWTFTARIYWRYVKENYIESGNKMNTKFLRFTNKKLEKIG